MYKYNLCTVVDRPLDLLSGSSQFFEDFRSKISSVTPNLPGYENFSHFPEIHHLKTFLPSFLISMAIVFTVIFVLVEFIIIIFFFFDKLEVAMISSL